jgi:hypothetical protein
MEAETCPHRPDHLAQMIGVKAAIIIFVLEIEDDSDNRNGAHDLHQPNMMRII